MAVRERTVESKYYYSSLCCRASNRLESCAFLEAFKPISLGIGHALHTCCAGGVTIVNRGTKWFDCLMLRPRDRLLQGGLMVAILLVSSPHGQAAEPICSAAETIFCEDWEGPA